MASHGNHLASKEATTTVGITTDEICDGRSEIMQVEIN